MTVAGWVEDIRNLGSIAFLILRDRKGTLQLTILKKKTPELFEHIISLPRESVISVKGLCKENEKVRNGYWSLAQETPDRFVVVNGMRPIGEIQNEIRQIIMKRVVEG